MVVFAIFPRWHKMQASTTLVRRPAGPSQKFMHLNRKFFLLFSSRARERGRIASPCGPSSFTNNVWVIVCNINLRERRHISVLFLQIFLSFDLFIQLSPCLLVTLSQYLHDRLSSKKKMKQCQRHNQHRSISRYMYRAWIFWILRPGSQEAQKQKIEWGLLCLCTNRITNIKFILCERDAMSSYHTSM